MKAWERKWTAVLWLGELPTLPYLPDLDTMGQVKNVASYEFWAFVHLNIQGRLFIHKKYLKGMHLFFVCLFRFVVLSLRIVLITLRAEIFLVCQCQLPRRCLFNSGRFCFATGGKQFNQEHTIAACFISPLQASAPCLRIRNYRYKNLFELSLLKCPDSNGFTELSLQQFILSF